ncbi:DUF4440 domain-containing protein [Streptosporangium sp. NPDC000396]|uniref:DUF4440 domain-containing protein n=1 Tax=Streptosporangium sp. NPDC000396 TaxID=3366185 RepID=UPI003674B900
MDGDPAVTPAQLCEQEVREMHQVIAARLGGGDVEPARFADPLAPDFTMIDPSGALTRKHDVVDRFGDMRGTAPGIDITIKNFRLVAAEAGLAVAVYEEWQTSELGANSRVSTVVFTADPSARNGYRWSHLHETWLPGQPGQPGRPG